MTQTKAGKNHTEAELPGAVDPFAVDFFGPSIAGDSDETEVREPVRSPGRARRDRSNWHRSLPKVSNLDAGLSNRLRFLPSDFAAVSTEAATAELARHLFRDEVSIELISASETKVTAALSGKTSRPRVFVSGSEVNSNARFACFFDVELANRIIDLVLDGAKDDFAARRHLSATEEVIIEYLAGRVLTAVNGAVDGVRYAIDGVGESIPPNFEESERGLELVLRLSIEDYENIITLILPSAFLDSLTQSRDDARLRFSPEVLGRTVADAEYRVVIGSSTLDGASLACLEREDIVLFDRLSIDADGGPVGAGPSVFVGAGNGFRLRGRIEDNGFNGNWILHLDEVVSDPSRRVFAPVRFNMENEEMEEVGAVGEATENAAALPPDDVSPALENVQVGLRVEIAGSRISLREIQELRAGQIIALGCGPNDPVRLAVEGSNDPVASGELVEIEGQLGIRLTKVFV